MGKSMHDTLKHSVSLSFVFRTAETVISFYSTFSFICHLSP